MRNMHRIKSFVINLESHDYRREHVMAQKDKSGLDLQIFTAITPDTMDGLPHEYNSPKTRYFSGRDMLPKEMACALSHLTLWRDLQKDEEVDYYLIFEDDIVFETNIADLLSQVDLSKIDFLKLSGKQPRPKKQLREINDSYFLYRFAFGPLDAAAYLVSKKGAEALEAYCAPIHSPIDILMDRSYDHGVPVYGILPYPVSADFCFDPNSPLYSSIGERKKYADDINWHEKAMVKIHRLWGSFKRHLATLHLHLVKE